MGYYTRFSGEIRIDPPIPFEEIKDTEFAGRDTDVTLKCVEVPVEGVPGAYRRVAVAIVEANEFSKYNAIPEVQWIIDRWGEGRRFTGRFDAKGEEPGDIWRLEIHDGRAVEVRPRIVWPDGTEEPPS
jgi:hypothetical protein